MAVSDSVVSVDQAVIPVAWYLGRDPLDQASAEDGHAHERMAVPGRVHCVGGAVVGEQHLPATAHLRLRRSVAVQQGAAESVHDLCVMRREAMIGQEALPSKTYIVVVT